MLGHVSLNLYFCYQFLNLNVCVRLMVIEVNLGLGPLMFSVRIPKGDLVRKDFLAHVMPVLEINSTYLYRNNYEVLL